MTECHAVEYLYTKLFKCCLIIIGRICQKCLAYSDLKLCVTAVFVQKLRTHRLASMPIIMNVNLVTLALPSSSVGLLSPTPLLDRISVFYVTKLYDVIILLFSTRVNKDIH